MQKKKDSHSDDLKIVSSSDTFKYILLFIVIFALGFGAVVVGAKKFMSNKKDEANPIIIPEDEEDISNRSEYQETIAGLKALLGDSLKFYNSNGLDASKMSNEDKLQIVYEYITKYNTLDTALMFPTYWESQVCDYDFLVDLNTNNDGSTYNAGICTYYVLPRTLVMETYSTIFNNNTLVLSDFIPNEHYKCMLGDENYACGLIKRIDYTGTLENHFQQRKVTKDKDDTIYIYESGYLKDTRSFIVNPDDGIDNYYLHSSDSDLYYYELRSKDNLTFKHVFMKDSKGKYYYVRTELV